MILVQCSLFNVIVVFVLICLMLFFVQCCYCYSLFDTTFVAPCSMSLGWHSWLYAPCSMLLLFLLLLAWCCLFGAPYLMFLVDAIIVLPNPYSMLLVRCSLLTLLLFLLLLAWCCYCSCYSLLDDVACLATPCLKMFLLLILMLLFLA